PSSSSPYSTKRDYRTKDVDVAKLKRAKADGVALALHGVDHTARPTWKLRETVEFYRDVLGLPLIHTISARGWGAPGHPDFLHFFSTPEKARRSHSSITSAPTGPSATWRRTITSMRRPIPPGASRP